MTDDNAALERQLAVYTYPECGHARRMIKRNRDNPPPCWECRQARWQDVPKAAREAAPRAAGLAEAIERDYLPAGVPDPLAWEFHRESMKRLQGAIGAEEAGGKRGAIGRVTGELRAMARTLPPTIRQAAEAAEASGVLRLVDQGHWAAGWLSHLTGQPMRPERDLEQTAIALRSWIDAALAILHRAGPPNTADTTRMITYGIQRCAEATEGARAYRELRLPVVRAGGVRYGRLDVVIWSAGYEIAVEIDSLPNRDSAAKLEFARDAGACPVWVRHGSGSVDAPEGIAVIDLRAGLTA